MIGSRTKSKHLDTSDITLTVEPYLPEHSTVQLQLKPEDGKWKGYMDTDLNFVS